MTGEDAGVAVRAPRWARWAATAAGLLLLVAAAAAVARQHDTIQRALDAVQQPAPWRVAVLAATVVASVALTGLTFRVLIARYGRVGMLEMQALIAAAALLNYLPLRPGLFGRIAYHRAFNAIPAMDAVKTTVQALVLSMAAAAYAAAALAACSVWPAMPLWAPAAAPVPLLAAGLARRRARLWAAAGLLRYLELGVMAVRYHAAFALIGLPIDAGQALAFACIGMVSMMVPLVGNGLGIREWAIGLAAPWLTGHVLELGLVAELVNRAAEVVLVALLGTAALLWLAARRRRG